MKQTKHFKRTAFPLSAKSMVSTLLLLIAMLLPQGAWAENFISEIKIGANSNQNTAKGYLSGYELINRDLNYGNGGNSWYIYLGYKTDTDASKAITGIMIVSGDYLGDEYLEGGTKTLSYDGKTWYRSPAQGAADLNKGAGGDDLTIFYTRDGNTVNGGKPLVSLSVEEDRGLSGYTYAGLYKNGAFSANGNTNQGAKGAARYITYTTHTHAYTAAFNWADDGKSCTATTNCADCGDTHSNLDCAVTDAPKSGAAATCTVMGWTTYTAEVTSNGKDFSATKDVQDIAALGHGSTGYTDSYSWTGNAYNDASKDTKACIFTLTCKKCSTKVVNGASLTCIKTAHVDATCRATGSTTYQATGSYTSSNSAYNYMATKTNDYTVAALGHGSTGYTESYVWTGNAYNEWSQDTKACIFTLTCKNCSTKVVNGASLTCIKTAHVDATCTATGITTYQATGSYTAANSAYNYSATKIHEYPIAALGHDHSSKTTTETYRKDAATCTTAATYWYKCSRCDDKSTTSFYTSTDDKDKALNHDYSQVVDEDYLVSAATCGSDAIYHEKCSRCDTHGAEWSATGTATGNHTFTNKTLTDDPVEDGLYAYACDYGCGTHTDDHIIKDFNGEGNHLELTKDGEGNYSTSEDIIINESDFYYRPVDFSLPVDFTAARVTFNRYIINDGGMWSFIVPFDIPAAQAAQLGTFYQYSKHEEGKVYFDDITKIDNADGIVRANTAYFFKPATDFPSITVENPTFGTTGTMPDATNPSEPGLYGTYSQIDIPVGAYGYAMHDGQSTFVKAGTGNMLRSFRAYLWLGSGASMAKARAFFGEEEVNGIIDIDAESEHDTPAYNLSGQRVTDDYKGIVIKNGKKTMVR